MKKLIEPEDWRYSKVLKLRVMQATHDELVAIQEKRGVCMAQLLREMIYESMNKKLTEK
jgi:predicted HicB family RNase H-like nuclease